MTTVQRPANSATIIPRFSMDGVRRGAVRLLPISLFVVPFGVAFGAAAIEVGMTVDQSLVMSTLMFAGAAQFAALDLWAHPLPWVSLALVVLAVNARHLILGAAMAPYVNGLPARHWFLSLMLLTDVSFADTYPAMKNGERDAGMILGGGLILWAVWVGSVAAGALAGTALGNLERFGVDVVMASFFAALTIGALPSLRHAVPVLMACGVAIVTLDVLPTGWNVIAAALAGGLIGALDRGASYPQKAVRDD